MLFVQLVMIVVVVTATLPWNQEKRWATRVRRTFPVLAFLSACFAAVAAFNHNWGSFLWFAVASGGWLWFSSQPTRTHQTNNSR